ncbi:MAG: hydantoinase/oxoprolinase family protein [Halobacteria archaeon]|nr:hydantoinase/oxoprolinase family protein [Halobacteria archaeon]
MMLLGVDTGGTFTDFVYFDGHSLRVNKVLSTPDAPERAILQGIRELGLEERDFYLVHGSTVATNAVLEGKGVATAYVTNHGLGDVLTIGRQSRRELYNLQPQADEPPVPGEYCLETGGRLDAGGGVVEPLTPVELDTLREQLESLGARSVAINLLFSYLDDRFEKQIEQALPGHLFVSRSSDILPEQGEYERGIATWLNAWVGPLVQGYLRRLKQAVEPSPVHVMQSSALTIDAGQADRRAVNLLLSGPAGGLMGALHVGKALNCSQLLTFDMGGTSTDVALLNGRVSLTSEGHIDRYPVAVPMVDMHTIGAGGGSIARVDAGGMLVVGPESAGADPGPACYGRNGRLPTVTDANLVLGRLRAGDFLGGSMRLDERAAREALQPLAKRIGVSVEAASRGVIELANEHMAQALRVISVERGIDPAAYTLTAFGGAGGLHVCALAEALSMRRALVPVHAGVLSALGMLAAPRGRELSHTLCLPVADLADEGVERHLRALVEKGRGELLAEGVEGDSIGTDSSLDLRYQGQSFTLNIPYKRLKQAVDGFHQAHRQRFGHRLEAPVELVNVRVSLHVDVRELPLECAESKVVGISEERANLDGEAQPVPVLKRGGLEAGHAYPGPMLVIDDVATTFIARGWRCVLHDNGCLILERTA